MAELKRPDRIEGYVHPEQSTYSREGLYKTFSSDKKYKKNEKFDTVTGGKIYVTMGDDVEEHCPICDSPAVTVCNCGYSDKKCQNSHIWYTDREGKIINGNPHIQR